MTEHTVEQKNRLIADLRSRLVIEHNKQEELRLSRDRSEARHADSINRCRRFAQHNHNLRLRLADLQAEYDELKDTNRQLERELIETQEDRDKAISHMSELEEKIENLRGPASFWMRKYEKQKQELNHEILKGKDLTKLISRQHQRIINLQNQSTLTVDQKDKATRTCRSPGGCDSCPDPSWCLIQRLDHALTTVDEERKFKTPRDWIEPEGWH